MAPIQQAVGDSLAVAAPTAPNHVAVARTRLEMSLQSPLGRVAVPLHARSIAPIPSSVSSRLAPTTAVRSTPSMSTAMASPTFCWWEPPCTSVRAGRGARSMSTPCGRYVTAPRGKLGTPRAVCPLVSPPQSGFGLRTPTSFHQMLQGTAARPKGTRAWHASLLWLKENLSVFLVYKQSQGVVHCQQSPACAGAELPHLEASLLQAGRASQPQQGDAQGVKWDRCNMGISLEKQCPQKLFPPRAAACPDPGWTWGCGEQQGHVPPPTPALAPSSTLGQDQLSCHARIWLKMQFLSQIHQAPGPCRAVSRSRSISKAAEPAQCCRTPHG